MIHHRTRPLIMTLAVAALAIAAAQAEESPLSRSFQLGEVLVVGGERDATEGALGRVDGALAEQRERADVADAAGLLPEVAIARVGGRNEKVIYVRGFDARQVPLFIDGIPVYVPYDGTVDPGRFSTFDLSELSVARGFSPVIYGPNTLGGAINVVSLRPTEPHEVYSRAGAFSGDGVEAGVRAGMLKSAGYAQGGISYRKRDHFRVSDDYTPAGAEDGGRRENSGARDLQLGVKAAWTPGDGDELALGFVRQDSEKDVPPYGGTDPRVRPRYWRYSEWIKNSIYLVGHKGLGLNGYVKPRAFYDTYDNTLDSYDDDTYTTQTKPYAFRSIYDDYTFGGSVEAGGEFRERHAPRAAVHFKRDVHREHNEGQPESEFSDDTWSLALEDSLRFNAEWSLVLGAAYERRESVEATDRAGRQPVSYPDNANDSFNPQAGLFYNMSTTGVLRATVAAKSRFPTLKDRYSYRLGTAIPNTELDPERAIHYELGYAGQPLPGLDARLSVFYSRIRDSIQQVDRVEYDEATDTWLYQLRNVGKAEHRGLEAGLAYRFCSAAKAGVDYALLERKNITSPELKPIDTPEHRALAFMELNPVDRVTLVPNVEYNSARYSSSDGVRVDGFWLWNLNAKIELPRGFALAAGVQNIFDENYELSEGYPEEGRNYYASVSCRF